MDPDTNLARQRELAAEIIAIVDGTKESSTDSDERNRQLAMLGEELAEHVQALDEWMSKGGYEPGPWARGKMRK